MSHIIYDGRCGFCIRTVKMLRRVDSFGTFEFCDLHDQTRLSEKFPLIRPEDAEEAMIAVTDAGVVFKGFYAFRRVIRASPWLWVVLPLFYLPGSAFVGTRIYRWVAGNRKAFGCRIEFPES